MDEIWKEVPGTDYSVSNLGRVASRKKGEWKVRRLAILRNGYSAVSLCTQGIQNTCYVHRLVAEAFLGPKPSPKHEVNHKNGARDDPRADNLEWVTRSENVRHSYDVLGQKGTAVYGESNTSSKLVRCQVLEIRALYAAGEFQEVIAASFEVSQATISSIVLRKTWAWL